MLLTIQATIVPTRDSASTKVKQHCTPELLFLWIPSRTRRATDSILGCHEKAVEPGQRFFVEGRNVQCISLSNPSTIGAWRTYGKKRLADFVTLFTYSPSA